MLGHRKALDAEAVAASEARLEASAAQELGEACWQLAAQKAAMEREREELQGHWSSLETDSGGKQEHAEVQAEDAERASSELLDLERDLQETLQELRLAQQEATEELATRNALRSELRACTTVFKSELSEMHDTGQVLVEERAAVREVAVGLGQNLQAAVTLGDELVTEGFRLRSEAVALEAEMARYQQQDPLSTDELRQALAQCRQLRELDEETAAEAVAARSAGGKAAGALARQAPAEHLLPAGAGGGSGALLALPQRSQSGGSVGSGRRLSTPSRGLPASPEEERARLLAVLERQDRQLSLLQKAAQRLSGEAYVAGPGPADDVDRAVRAAFKRLGLRIAPPLTRLPGTRGSPDCAGSGGGSSGSAQRGLFLFDIIACEARVDPEADTGGPDHGAGVRFRMLSGEPPRSGLGAGAAGEEEHWLTAAQLAEAVGWSPQDSAGARRSRRRAPSR